MNHVLPLFSRENLHIIIQERMQADTSGELNRLYEFLNVSQYDLDTVETTAEIAKDKQLDLKKDGEIKIYKNWRSQSGEMPYEPKEFLTKYFQDHNKKLFEFLGYDIPEWEDETI
jgi:hypothetical protein